MTCGHRPEVRLTWIGHNEERREVRACESCAVIVWNRLAQPHRETFTCAPLEVRPC